MAGVPVLFLILQEEGTVLPVPVLALLCVDPGSGLLLGETIPAHNAPQADGGRSHHGHRGAAQLSHSGFYQIDGVNSKSFL